MNFSVGDFVWLASAVDAEKRHGPPAIVIAAYVDVPRIFLCNEQENKRWLEAEDIGVGIVYDILHNGRIEVAVLGEWLIPFEAKVD